MVFGSQERKIHKVLERHASALIGDDSALADYIVEILNNEDSFGDVESLQQTVAPFLGGDSEIAARIIEEVQPRADGPTTKASHDVRRLEIVDEGSMVGHAKTRDETGDACHEPSATVDEASESEDGENPAEEVKKTTPRKTRKTRHRRQKKQAANSRLEEKSEETPVEDDASTWNECQERQRKWGGRGRGGRGEYSGAVNHIKSNIHLSNVTVSLPNGTDLLSNTFMDIQKGHRYGLIGRNGVGKSTLLKRLAKKAIPGMPHDMFVLLVQQQIDGSNETPLKVLLQSDVYRNDLMGEQEELNALLESSDDLSETLIAETVERLGEVIQELDAIDADKAEERALDILKGLQFSSEMLQTPTHNLSGGWRMRLSLARALFIKSDLLLLDEVSNHIDLDGLDWLVRYLSKEQDRTMIIVSHDRSFMDSVCTDIIHMNHKKLKYHPGNFSEFERQHAEKSAREAQILDAVERQQSKAQAFVQKQESMARSKSADPNKQRQAKMIKEKKMDRIGNYREDGKRYKQNSLHKLSEKHVRMAQKVVIEVDEAIIKMHFPNPQWPIGISPDGVIVRMEKFSFGYRDSGGKLLKGNTLGLQRGCKAALVGKNGAGKSTLMRLFAGEVEATALNSSGELWHHPNIRIGHITQFSVEELERYAHLTVVEYAEEKLRNSNTCRNPINTANSRQYLGAFGLGGKHALRPIGKLSGGERMRLCFATVLAGEPHLLLLDESTNHCDYETLDSMSKALNEFQGSVLMVSHNQGFLSGFCQELWVLEDGKITVNHGDSFDELFTDYRSASTDNGLSTRRQEQTNMAKRAANQRATARQNTALL